MFKKIILVSIVLLLTMPMTAQIIVDRNGGQNGYINSLSQTTDHRSSVMIKYGVKTGLNISSMSDFMAFKSDFSSGVGFRIGGFVNMRWGQRTENSLPGTGVLGFQPELIYSNQLVKIDVNEIKMNYISIPMFLKIYPTTALCVELGPEFSYLITTSPSKLDVDDAKIKVGDCKGLCMGASVGIAYDFNTGLTVGIRYTHGLTDLAKNLKWRNNNTQITIGMMF